MPTLKYQVILADPPWFYQSRKTGGERKDKTRFGGGASKHYPLMKDAELLAMSSWVKSITAENAALFMWATWPRMDFALELVKAWGFEFRTGAYTWVKPTDDFSKPILGPGYYTASNTESVLLGVKGKMPVAKKMTSSVLGFENLAIVKPRTRHSQKPQIHELINALYPKTCKIELFARDRYQGMGNWDFWGNEIDPSMEFSA